MANIDNLPIETGNYVNSEENVENLVDILRDGDQSSALFPDKYNTLNTQPAKSGNMVGSDSNVYNIVDLLKNIVEIGHKIIVKSDTIPTAGEDYDGEVYQYVGTTNATYTHGYIYECIGSQSILARAIFEPAYFVFDENTGSLANFFAQATDDYLQVVSGRFKYLQAGDVWNINGLDENGDTVFSDYQLYTQDLIDAGFTFIVPMEDIADEAEVSYELTYFTQTNYAWTRIDVQPHAEIGRYLSSWNCATGLAATNPPESPYIYKTGDYFIVGTIDDGGTNYKPSGTQYVSGTASTTVESGIVSVNDTYLYDGTNWTLLKTSSTVTSVNGQTGAVTVQETLVNQTNIKSVNGNTLLGSGNLELSTYLPYPSAWHTTSSYTTAQFCGEVAADTSATVGKAYLGEVNLSDLPQSLANGEVVVEIMDGTTAANKVIVLSLSSGTTAPYTWKYTYWNGGSNTSGWVAPATINDSSTSSTVETWSAYQLNSTIGNIESILETI